MTNTWIPAFMQNMETYLINPAAYMYGRWNAPAGALEGGVDLSSAAGTPVYAIADGTIQGAGNFWHGGGNCLYQGGAGCTPGYGVITTRVNVPGYGLQDLYYQHLTLSPNIQSCQGNCTQVVHAGDLLGYVTPGVNEVEMGFNADWGGVWGTNHPGTWATDPRPMLVALLNQGQPATLGNQVGSGGPINTDITSGLLSGLGLPTAADVQTFMQRLGLIFIGGTLLLVGIGVLFISTPEGKTAVKTAGKAALL